MACGLARGVDYRRVHACFHGTKGDLDGIVPATACNGGLSGVFHRPWIRSGLVAVAKKQGRA
jgi:hypothetical protein